MQRPSLDRSARLRIASWAVLGAGLLAGIVIYWNAGQVPPVPFGADPEDSKQYLRQMEVYGGKANVLAFEIRQWFDGLWHGRSLAVTVSVIALLAAGVLQVAAIPLPPLETAADAGDGAGDEAGRDGAAGGR